MIFNNLLASWSGALLALLACLVVYGYHPIKRYRYRHIPGPPPTWLIGNLLTILKKGFPDSAQDWAKEYGGVFKVWQGGTVLIVVEDPVAVRMVNMRNHERPPILTSLAGKEKEFDNAGLLLSHGTYWQSLRQAWQSMFHPSSLRQYTGLMNASAQRLVDALAAKAKTGEPVEMWRLFGCLTMEVVGSTAFGVQLHMLDDTSKALPTATGDIEFEESDDDGVALTKAAAILFGFAGPRASPYVALRLLFPEGTPLWSRLATYCPDAALRRVLKARRKIRSVCFRLISEAKQRGPTTVPSGDTNGRTAGGTAASSSESLEPPEKHAQQPKRKGALPPGGFLSHLLASNNKLISRPFTDTEVAAQAFVFLLAGYETTASALAFAVYHVARNPDAEKKLLQEIDAFGRGAVPTFDDLEQFPYLDAVFSEALRLSPPAAFGTIRTAREDFQLCGYTIKKGWFLNTAQYSFQRNPKYWTNPDKFQPERFLTDDNCKSSPAWAPFGDGGRSCVGVRFANAEARIALIRLYQNFTLRLLPGQDPLETTTQITMSPKYGVKVTVHARS